MTQIFVRVVRPLLYLATSRAAGETLRVDPLGAGELIASGRAVLADPADRGIVDAAIVAERDRTLSRLRAADQRAGAAWVLQRKRVA